MYHTVPHKKNACYTYSTRVYLLLCDFNTIFVYTARKGVTYLRVLEARIDVRCYVTCQEAFPTSSVRIQPHVNAHTGNDVYLGFLVLFFCVIYTGRSPAVLYRKGCAPIPEEYILTYTTYVLAYITRVCLYTYIVSIL